MDDQEAGRILGVAPGAPWTEVRRAYRGLIQTRHPDRAGVSSTTEAARIIEAYATLRNAQTRVVAGSCATGTARTRLERPVPAPAPVPVAPTAIVRMDDDTIAFGAPADETFLLLLEAGHDIGELTYVDRSVPILEVICQFVGTPALSLVITLQGRMDRTEAFCTVESIESRPGPPTADVVDVLVDLLHQRQESAATHPS
ncbi:MAG: J domain-containing protein [Actinomycetota bacterium]|nr:J domain-containing protein [Actinomycetota bacterium]